MSPGTRIKVLMTVVPKQAEEATNEKSNHSSRALKTSVEQRCVRFSLDICSVFIDETDNEYLESNRLL